MKKKSFFVRQHITVSYRVSGSIILYLSLFGGV